jgi:hypothetical protein
MESRTVAILIAAAVAVVSGCSKGEVELANVQGRITLDGTPLPKASIMFAPLGGKGGPAIALTDDAGQYELKYTYDRDGAVVGDCIVRIKTGFQSIEDEEQGIVRPEKVPAKYNVKSTLKVNVQPGGGPYDFDLTSK